MGKLQRQIAMRACERRHKREAKPKAGEVMKRTPENRVKTGVGKGGIAPPKEHQFKEGESGNPGGRPKGRKLSAAYAAILEQQFPGDHEGRTYAELIALGQAREAYPCHKLCPILCPT
jgi:hypothetical protein